MVLAALSIGPNESADSELLETFLRGMDTMYLTEKTHERVGE